MRAARFASDWIWKISRTWARTKITDYNYQQIVLINTLSHSRKAWIECEPNLDLDPWGKRKLCDTDGNLVPMQIVTSEYAHPSMTRILFRAELPANGLTQYLIREFPDILVDAGGVEDPETNGSLRVLRASIENEPLGTARDAQGHQPTFACSRTKRITYWEGLASLFRCMKTTWTSMRSVWEEGASGVFRRC